jgi:predicted short-subunit dehydrogenase-like oxidoreductase (DUF2520 family)
VTHQSIEAGCMNSVAEGDLDAVRERLQKYMLDGELIEFYEQVSTLLDLVGNEVTRRRENDRRWQTTPTADTGEINVIRGRE